MNTPTKARTICLIALAGVAVWGGLAWWVL